MTFEISGIGWVQVSCAVIGLPNDGFLAFDAWMRDAVSMTIPIWKLIRYSKFMMH